MLLLVTITNAQDFTFSQFYEMPMLRNPALAGVSNADVRIQSSFRSQWSSITIPYQTQALSAEVRFPIGFTDDYITGGLQVTNDVAGDSKLGRIQLLPVITFHKSINDDYSYLNFSLMGGLVQSQFDPSKMTFDDEYIQGLGFTPGTTNQVFTKTSLSYTDLSAGLSYNSSNDIDVRYYLGVAGYHLIRSKVSFYNEDNVILKPRYVINAGINMPTGDNDRFFVYGDYLMQGGNHQFLSGLLYKHIFSNDWTVDDEETNVTALTIGGAYRWADAFVPILKLDMNKFFVGVSYDVNTSSLKSYSQLRGGYEFTAGFKSNLNVRVDTRTKCPRF
jgi:type IX secretion system PorP/SprF family membrane protein